MVSAIGIACHGSNTKANAHEKEEAPIPYISEILRYYTAFLFSQGLRLRSNNFFKLLASSKHYMRYDEKNVKSRIFHLKKMFKFFVEQFLR